MQIMHGLLTLAVPPRGRRVWPRRISTLLLLGAVWCALSAGHLRQVRQHGQKYVKYGKYSPMRTFKQAQENFLRKAGWTDAAARTELVTAEQLIEFFKRHNPAMVSKVTKLIALHNTRSIVAGLQGKRWEGDGGFMQIKPAVPAI